jgi:hypothetical protein
MSIECVPVLRLYLGRIWPVPLKKIVMWARSTDTTATTLAVDTALWLSEECCTHIYRGPKRKE